MKAFSRMTGTLWLVVGVVLFVLVCISVAAYQEYHFNHMTPDEHLSAAHEYLQNFAYNEAQQHLDAIPHNSLAHDSFEFNEIADAIAKYKAQIAQQQAAQQAYPPEQARPVLRCGIQTATGKEFMSLDNAATWVPDDGRCMERVYKKRNEDAQIYAKRDEDAQIYSYWSTTIRVEADMSQSWLNQEERVCTSYPNAEGRVATVVCNADAYNNGTDHLRDIPITFWGGVDRGHPSTWRCRREGDDFACRAID